MSLLSGDISDVLTDLRFGRIHSALTLLAQVLLTAAGLLFVSATFSTQNGVVDLMKALLSPEYLFAHTILILCTVLVAKRSTGHKRSLALPHHTKPIKGDPTKGPFIRRTVLRVKAFIFRISPIKTVLHGALIFSLIWIINVYLVVCFGAPVFSEHSETLSFSYLIVILTTFPILLIYGPETDSFGGLIHVLLSDQKVLEKNDPLGHQLFVNCCCVVLGAWLGAFPIPLDWDRPWQKWPTSCACGALIGSFLANAFAFAKLCFQQKSLTSGIVGNPKKKRT